MTPEIFKTLKRIQIRSDQLAKELLAGAYRSAFKGRGMEFEEVREYQPGDEIRSIDWNVTAHMNTPYVKVFREERELSVMLVVDISSSTRFGTLHLLKSHLIAEIAAVIAFSAIKNNDKLGLILFSDRVEIYLPPLKSHRHILRVIRELLVHQPQHSGTNISEALHFLGRVQSKSGVCFLISDFICDDFKHEASLTSKHHDLIAISVTDPSEVSIPELSLVEMEDLELGTRQIINTSGPAIKKEFQEISQARIQSNQQFMGQIGAGFIDIRTDRPYLPPIKKFFQFRGRK